MCGIAGTLRFDGEQAAPGLLKAMSDCLYHRGPDDAGCFSDGPAGLAYRRLAILDLSPAGHQPMLSANGDAALIFCGEIYNFRELRAELEARGHRFRSTADSEVLLAAYVEWDVGCLAHLSGMWAFAIWDKRRRRLFCARDRFGIKPLYYHLSPERLLFASEIKALFTDTATPNRPNDRRIYDYLVYGYLDHTEETCFEAIRQLPPAHFMLIEDGATAPSIRRYWQLDAQQRLTLDDDTAAERFAELLTRSVRLHLQSDVPVGTCLSGGLDSSSIVVITNQLLRDGGLDRTVIGERQLTFSACYDDPRYDERRFIRPVVEQTGVANAQVFPDSLRLLDDLDQFIWHQEEPCGSTSIYAQWCVMRLAHEHGVTVLLDGQGADELLMGYPIYQAAWWATLARQGHWLRLRSAIGAYGRRFGADRSLRMREMLRLALPEALAAQISARLGHTQPAWLGARMHAAPPTRPAPATPFRDPLRRLLYGMLVSLNLPALLRYEDRNSMAFSIEARVPFLDERLAEFAFALPTTQLVRDGETKWLLRRALRGVLPEPVRTRQDKLGFATPGDAWLRSGLAPLVEEVFSSSTLARRGYIDAAQARARWEQHKAGQASEHHLIWRWLHLELWARRFLDQRPLS
jgi:asparagine synthase (glutamine-hydrolysing)